MTPEELKSKERTVAREFPETDAAFKAVRQAMLEALINSNDPEGEKRERLFRSIRALDEVRTVMMSYLSAGSQDIDNYIKQITDPATTDQ